MPCQRRQRSAYSKLKSRLTRCPTQRSALECAAPASHEPGRHVWGELRQQPVCIDVSCSCLVDVYHCLPSRVSATTTKAGSIVPAMPTEASSIVPRRCILYEHTLDNKFQVNRQSTGSYCNIIGGLLLVLAISIE